MTDQQINQAIAEACGWAGQCVVNTDGNRVWVTTFPLYCSDLNAMHEAEKILNKDEFMPYCNLLWPLGHGVWEAIHTQARQRAEAFLKTLGKWEEAE